MPVIGRSRRRIVNRPEPSTTTGNGSDCLVGLEVEVTPEQQPIRQKELLVKGKGEMDGIPDNSEGLQEQAEESVHFSLVDCAVDEKGQTQTDKELDRRLLAIVALKELVTKQRGTIRKLKSAQTEYKRALSQTFHFRKDSSSRRVSPLSEVGESDTMVPKSKKHSSKKSMVSFGPNLDKTDEEVVCVMNCDDYESVASNDVSRMEKGFQESVSSIKAYAKQVDTSIALDELYRVKAELASTKRRLKSRSSEVEDLRSQLEAYEHRLSTVELQRELYKAEAEISKKNLDAFLANQLEYSNAETPVSSHLTMEDLPEEDSLTTVETPRRLPKVKNGDGARTTWELNPAACVSPDDSPLHQSSPSDQRRSPDNEIPSSGLEHEMQYVGANQHSPSASSAASRHRHFNLFRSKNRSSDRSSNNNKSESIRRKLPSFRLKKNSGRNGENTSSPEVDRRSKKAQKSKPNDLELRDRISIVHRYYENSVNSMQKQIVDLNTTGEHERQKPMTPNKSITNQDRLPEVSSKENEHYQGQQSHMYQRQNQTQINRTIPSLMDDSDSEPRFC